MISLSTSFFLGSVAGLHAACYGAYKDSPYERFKPLRFVREIVIATVIAVAVWQLLPEYRLLPLFLFFLFVLAWSRIITEAYKLFVRVEPQSQYLIPSQVHLWRRIINSRIERLILGVAVGLGLYLFWYGSQKIYQSLSLSYSAAIIGLLAGIATALGGGYKDGLFEGFFWRKFIRSPFIGTLAGATISYISPLATHTHTYSSGQLVWKE